jgi:diguanylate cyclase (GGDEF)-like protein
MGTTGDVDQLMIRIFSEAVQLGSIFDMDMSREKSYDAIFEEANQALGRNSLHLQKTLTEQMRLTEDLKEKVSRDSLTGLHNHRSFHELLDRELDRALRYRRPLSLIFCDLDHFKNVNDTHGHQMGDEVLVGVARLFEKTLRKSDFVARYGGEEFAFLLVETPVKEALDMAERLRKLASEQSHTCATEICRVTISFGVTGLDPEHPVVITKEEMIRYADEALYEAKRCGRNQACVSMPAPGRVGAPASVRNAANQGEPQGGWRS